MPDIIERLRSGWNHDRNPEVEMAEAADVIETLRAEVTLRYGDVKYVEQQLAAETNNKQEFERDWLACCDKLNDERRIHLELEETLVKKLEAAQAHNKMLLDALSTLANHFPDGETRAECDRVRDIVDAALAQPTDYTALKAALESERIKTAVVFDGYAVMQQLDARQKARTSQENVTDVLDAVARLMCSNASLTGAEPVCVASELKR